MTAEDRGLQAERTVLASVRTSAALYAASAVVARAALLRGGAAASVGIPVLGVLLLVLVVAQRPARDGESIVDRRRRLAWTCGLTSAVAVAVVVVGGV